MSDGDEPRPEKPQVDDLLERTDRQRQGENMCFVSPEAKAASQAKVAGETDFESRDLEVMQAMVDDANPSELETAATDLWTAAGKIKEIGEEIKNGVDKVGWKGEFGETFRGWGHRLGDDIIVLSEYTENAGKNIGAAGEGLSQVKTAMPKPDYTYAYAPRPETFPAPEKVETNPTYAAALKKEKDRGEAIQQMNRLASYYRVTRENMGSAPEPKFGTAPDMGFPVPAPEAPERPGGSAGGGPDTYTPSPGGGKVDGATGAPGSSVPPTSLGAGVVQGGAPGAPVTNGPPVSPGGVVNTPPVGTDLNSAALPTTTPVDRGAAVVNSPVNSGPSQGPNLIAGPGHQGPNNRSGYSKTPGSGYGQSKTPGPINGVPRSVSGPGGTPTGRSTGPTTPAAGRHTGIVGGTPQSSGSQSATPRIPRGTVVGGEHGPMGRPPMGTGGGGGPAGAGTGSPSPGRRLASTPGGVVGHPRSGPLPGASARPFTPGGTGLAANGSAARPMGMAPRTGPATPGERSRNDSERPDYLTEDEETWATGRAGHVPPVVE